jgi:hypothetical protein
MAARSPRWRVGDAPDPQTAPGGGHVSPVWHDGTERPLPRPREAEEPQAYYRGQQKCHTITTRLVIEEPCQLCCLSATDDGEATETSLAALAGDRLPPGSCLSQAMGVQGAVLAGVTRRPPKKKPRGGELTPPEQATNRQLSSVRSRIEQALGGVQRFRIVPDKIRLLTGRIRDTVMDTWCGLHTVRLQYRPWHYAS